MLLYQQSLVQSQQQLPIQRSKTMASKEQNKKHEGAEVEKQSKRVQELIQCICSESLSETFQQLTDERIEKAGTDIEELEKIKEEARLAFEVEQFLDSLDNSEEMQQRLEDVYRVRDFDALRELVREAKRNKAKKSNGEEWREKNLAALNRILSG